MKKILTLLTAVILLFTACSKKSSIQPQAQSNAKAITKFVFTKADNPTLTADVEGVFSGNSINIVVGNIDKRALKPTITHTAKTVSPNSLIAQDFTGPVTYTLTAEDGSTATYIVNVSSNTKAVTKFVFTKADNPLLSEDVEGTISGNEIKIVLHSTTKTNLKPIITHTAKTINPNNSTAQDFTNPVTYTLTAEDGTTTNYIVKVENRDVYVVGSEFSTNYKNFHAVYWKNGMKVTLDDNGANNSEATGIAIHNNDIYIIGREIVNFTARTVYWKNGVRVLLSNFSSSADAICIVKNNVYIAGTVNDGTTQTNKVVYWKNGNMVDVSDGSIQQLVSIPYLYVSENEDVYIAGSSSANPTYNIMYWKNGTMNMLDNLTTFHTAKSIAVVGTDVYVFADKQTDKGVYWKNGTKNEIADGTVLSSIVVNNDLYKAGKSEGVPTYWKNDTKFVLENVSGWAEAITNIGSDIYIAGYASNIPTYWINGKSITMANAATFRPSGIAVTKN